MNIVLIEQIKHLSENKTKFRKIKEMSSNWKAVVVISIGALTLKVASEQLVMLLVR